MHTKSFLLAVIVAASTFVAAQEECPGVCGQLTDQPIDVDRFISDCTARCNTSFGQVEEAQACIDACNDWQNLTDCEITTISRRRSVGPTGRRHRDIDVVLPAPDDGFDGFTSFEESELDDDLGSELEERNALSACLNQCASASRFSNFCPKGTISTTIFLAM
jgi:hypothetical protein